MKETQHKGRCATPREPKGLPYEASALKLSNRSASHRSGSALRLSTLQTPRFDSTKLRNCFEQLQRSERNWDHNFHKGRLEQEDFFKKTESRLVLRLRRGQENDPLLEEKRRAALEKFRLNYLRKSPAKERQLREQISLQ